MTSEQVYADGNFVVCGGLRFGPFSSHWAACAAMIRRHDPAFKSTGGDLPADLEKEQTLPPVVK